MKKEAGFIANLKFGELHIAGDEAYGFCPSQLMVASIAVCGGGVLRTILEKKRMEIEDITIKTDVMRNEQEANRIEKIKIHFEIKGKDLDERKIEKSLELTKKHCSMYQSVKNSIEVVETFSIL